MRFLLLAGVVAVSLASSADRLAAQWKVDTVPSGQQKAVGSAPAAPAAPKPTAPVQKKTAEPRPQSPPENTPSAARLPMPDARALAVLIHNVVVAVGHGSRTRNFTVVHALAAPGFQKTNTPAKLAQVFAGFGNVDLRPVAIFGPMLDREPVIDGEGRLRLVGHYRTEPQRIGFDLTFVPVGREWQVFTISLSLTPAQQLGNVSDAR